MNWREETIPLMDKEAQTKNFIKNELMNYYFYLEKRNEYHELVKQYEDLQNDPSIGGSLAKMPERSQCNLSPQVRIAYDKIDAESNLTYYEYKLNVLDSWMNVLTESLHNVVKMYVMKYQCENLHEASIYLGYEEDTVNKYTKRAIDRIYGKIKKFA